MPKRDFIKDKEDFDTLVGKYMSDGVSEQMAVCNALVVSVPRTAWKTRGQWLAWQPGSTQMSPTLAWMLNVKPDRSYNYWGEARKYRFFVTTSGLVVETPPFTFVEGLDLPA
jgi:hypothetical protein